METNPEKGHGAVQAEGRSVRTGEEKVFHLALTSIGVVGRALS